MINTGIVGLILRFITPLTIAPSITMVNIQKSMPVNYAMICYIAFVIVKQLGRYVFISVCWRHGWNSLGHLFFVLVNFLFKKLINLLIKHFNLL